MSPLTMSSALTMSTSQRFVVLVDVNVTKQQYCFDDKMAKSVSAELSPRKANVRHRGRKTKLMAQRVEAPKASRLGV